MDESNEETAPDLKLRVTAIQLSIQANSHPDGYPPECIGIARDFYLLLAQRDPIVDVGVPVKSEKRGECEVFNLDKFREERPAESADK